MKKAFLLVCGRLTPKRLGIVLYLLVVAFIGLTSGPGCAVILPPPGGPKDTLPPVLVTSVPKDSSLHFKAKKIVLTFDEFVQLDNNMFDNLIVSPNPVSLPTVEGKLRQVTILLKDSLLPNTTYSINFGRGLKDVNEGNVAKNFTYIFSTGDKLDQGKLTGNVTLAETGKIDTTLLVLLHNNLNDTSVRKNNPIYFTRLDSKGNYVFRNIAPATYNVFVLPSQYSKKYDDSTKMFAFLNSPVVIPADSVSAPSVNLVAYQQYKPKPKKTANGNANAAAKKKAAKEIDKQRLKMAVSARDGQDLLSPLVFTFMTKITDFDSLKIVLTDTSYHPIKGYSFVTVDTTLMQFGIKYPWPENTAYKVIVGKEAFKDSTGNTINKTDTIAFKTKKESDYGSIRLHFNNLPLSKHPVIQLVQSDKIVQTVPLRTNEWFQQIFLPGDYEVRLLFDDNQNGVWDPGDYSIKRQPEIVIFFPRKLTIKANFENEVDFNL